MGTILNDLPEKHPLRNKPLGEINAVYRWKKSSEKAQWHTVQKGAPKLVKSTFNQLGESWTKYDWWCVDDVM